jgi:hypothetical protein
MTSFFQLLKSENKNIPIKNILANRITNSRI